MPIVLRVGRNDEHTRQEKFVGDHTVLEHLAQDRYLSVKSRGGRYFSGGRIIAVSESDLKKLGIEPGLPVWPVRIVMHCSYQNEEKTGLVSEFRVIRWHRIGEIFMPSRPARDFDTDKSWTYDDLFEHFQRR